MLLNPNEEFRIHQGDCIEHMATMPEHSVDCSVFSPPFPSLFCYTSLPEDIGNSNDVRVESKLHLSWFYNQLVRIIRPGRIVVVHVTQIPGLARNNEKGIVDFRGLNIRLGERAGFTYEYDWLVAKNPQAQAIRTHSHCLQFAGLERDRSRSRGALADYLIKFSAPGKNEIPIDSPGVTRDEWIDWAEAAWHWRDVRETDTLNTAEAKGDDDVKHICPLQLGVIRRLVKLYSNPGEIVFSPFSGIGSELYCALELGRRAYGCEIKDEYVAAAQANCEKAIRKRQAEDQQNLFAMAK